MAASRSQQRRRSARARQRRNEAIFERLERRELLTATPFSDAQKAAILAGLGNLKAFGDRLDTGADLASPVPGLAGATIGDLVDVGGRLDTGVSSAVQGYFAGDASPTTDELKTYLAALDQFKLGTVAFTVGTDADATIRFDFSFAASAATPGKTLALDALDGVGDLGLSFAASQPVSVTGGVAAKLGFSVTNGGTFSFFVSDLDATVNATGIGLTSAGRLGFLDVGLSGGAVSLSAKGESQLASEVAFTTSELGSDASIVFKQSGTLDATLPLTASIGGFATKAGSLPTVTLASWSQLDVLGLCGHFAGERPPRAPEWDGPPPRFVRVEWR